MILDTSDRLYLLVGRWYPMCFLNIDPAVRYCVADPRIRVYQVSTRAAKDTDEFHEILHKWNDVPCRGEPNMTRRRDGGGSWLDHLVRDVIGCADTPIYDVDKTIVVSNGNLFTIQGVREEKRPGESFRSEQSIAFFSLRDFGLEVDFPDENQAKSLCSDFLKKSSERTRMFSARRNKMLGDVS